MKHTILVSTNFSCDDKIPYCWVIFLDELESSSAVKEGLKRAIRDHGRERVRLVREVDIELEDLG